MGLGRKRGSVSTARDGNPGNLERASTKGKTLQGQLGSESRDLEPAESRKSIRSPRAPGALGEAQLDPVLETC